MSRYSDRRKTRTKRDEDDDESGKKNYITASISALFTLTLVYWLFPDTIPYEFWGFWEIKGTFWDWMYAAWPIFVWGVGFNIVYFMLFPRPLHAKNYHPAAVLLGGTIRSAWAGTTEEIAHRWILFLSGTAWATLGNFLFFGFAGFGIPKFFHMWVWGPIANFTTFGYLEEYIFHPTHWAVGAGLLYSNAFFRDGHKYQGLVGWTNSWFLGMFFFWILFQYGLLAAILVHFLYNFFIYAYAALRSAFRGPPWS